LRQARFPAIFDINHVCISLQKYANGSKFYTVKFINNSIVNGQFEAGRPKVVTINFRYAITMTGVRIESELIDYSEGEDRIVKLGEYEGINALLSTSGIQYHELTIGPDLIELEIKSGNNNVGQPIDTLALTSSGPQWYQKTALLSGLVSTA
jgi:hypothetical protein